MQRAEAIRTAPNGDVLYGPKGIVLPVEPALFFTDPVHADLKLAGLLDDSGVGLTPNKETGEIPVWQSAAPGKYYVEGASFDLDFTFAQWDAHVMRLYWGVAHVTTPGGNARLDVSSNPGLDELLMVVRWLGDNDSHNVIVVKRGMVTNRNQIKINRTEGTMSGLTFSAMDSNGLLAQLYTDDEEVLAQLNES